jgi:FtsH ternary system-associated peptide
MSRSYRVAVSGSVERVVHIEDGVCGSLELLPILPKERMHELLAKELEGRGYEIEGSIARKKPEKGIVIEVDIEKSTVTVKVDADVALDIKRERTGHVAEEAGRGRIEETRAKLKDQVDAELARAAADEVERERRRITQKLEGKLRDLKQEIDGAINRVTGEALKEKARGMGEIEEIAEDKQTGSLTIKVKL